MAHRFLETNKLIGEDERQGPDHRCGPIIVRGPMNSCGPKLPSRFYIVTKTVLSSFEKQKQLIFITKSRVLGLIAQNKLINSVLTF